MCCQREQRKDETKDVLLRGYNRIAYTNTVPRDLRVGWLESTQGCRGANKTNFMTRRPRRHWRRGDNENERLRY
jgi:hypothetical protein